LTSTDTTHVELYDVVTDPLERDDVATKQPDLVQRMRARLRDWQRSLPAQPSGEVFSSLREQ
jgi:hypothetical protein